MNAVPVALMEHLLDGCFRGFLLGRVLGYEELLPLGWGELHHKAKALRLENIL